MNMNDFIVESTIQTPAVHLSRTTGLMTIKGRSIPDDAIDFWSDVINWFESYMENPVDVTEFHIELEYLNIASSKRILLLLGKLNELKQRGFNSKVCWYYHESDEDMLHVGHDYEFMVDVPFEFNVYVE